MQSKESDLCPLSSTVHASVENYVRCLGHLEGRTTIGWRGRGQLKKMQANPLSYLLVNSGLHAQREERQLSAASVIYT